MYLISKNLFFAAGDVGAGSNGAVSDLTVHMEEMDITSQNRSVTGVLASHPDSRDVHIHNLSILFHGVELLVDCDLELNVGRRYGLIGLNGCGKNFLLTNACIHEISFTVCNNPTN